VLSRKITPSPKGVKVNDDFAVDNYRALYLMPELHVILHYISKYLFHIQILNFHDRTHRKKNNAEDRQFE
jgi:hypothetical protein